MMLAFPDCPCSGRYSPGLASSASGGFTGSRDMEGLLGAAPAGSLVAPVRLSAPLQCRASRSAASSSSSHGIAFNRVRTQAIPSVTGISVTAAAAAALAAPPAEARQVLRRDGDGPAADVLDSPEGALSADVGAILASANDCCSPRDATLSSAGGETLPKCHQESECFVRVAELKAGLWPSPLNLPNRVEVTTSQDLRGEGVSQSSAKAGGQRKAKTAGARRQAKKVQEPRAKSVVEDRWRRDGPRTKLLQRIEYEEARSRDGRGQGGQDRSHTSAARALTFCLRGVQTVEEVSNVVRGAESALSMPAISSCLSKLGFEGQTGAAISLLQWLRKEGGSASAAASGTPRPAPDMAQGGAARYQTIAPEVQSAHMDGATADSEAGLGGEPAGGVAQQGRRAPNVFTYNAALGALRTNREWKHMDSVLAWMQEDGVPMDTVTLNIFLAAYLDLGKDDVAWDVLAKAAAAAEPRPDLFTVRTMVPALLRWRPEQDGVLPPAEGAESSHTLREAAPVVQRGESGPREPAAVAQSGGPIDASVAEDVVTVEGYQEWEAQWQRLHLLLRIFKGASEAVGLRREGNSQCVEGHASQSTGEAVATTGGAKEASGAEDLLGAAVALASPGLQAAPAGSAGAGGCPGGSPLGDVPGLSGRPSAAEDSGAAHSGTPGNPGAGRGQSPRGPRQRRARQRQQQQEVEACLRVACSQMVRAVVLLHERHSDQGLGPGPSVPQGPQPQSGLQSAGAAPTAAEQGQGQVGGRGAAASAPEAVPPIDPTPIAGSNSRGQAQEESRSGAPARLEPGDGAQSASSELDPSGALLPRGLPAEDPRGRVWARAAVVVAEAMADAGVRRDGPTFYWLLKALCLSPGVQQRRIRALYREMREQRYLPQLGLCHSVLEALGAAKRWWAALEVYEDMGRRGPQPTEETQALLRAQFNLLLNAARKRRIWKWSLLLLRRMQAAGVAPDRRSWATALVTCATANATEAAVDVFRGMLEAGHQAGPREYGALLSALEKGRQWAQAHEVWLHMGRVGVPPGLQSYTTMIAVLGAQGLYGRAVALFEDMRGTRGLAPDTAAYNALISACAVAGEGARAVDWIHKMEEAGLQPDHTSYEQAALALCNQGQWHAARALLGTMGAKGLHLSQRCESILLHCSQHLVHTSPAEEEDTRDGPADVGLPSAGGVAPPPAGPKELLAA